MLVYKLFDGREFYDKAPNDEELAKCLSKEVYKIHPRHATKYVQEFLPDLVKIIDEITVEGACAESERLRIIQRMPLDGRLTNKSVHRDSEHISLTIRINIPSELLLHQLRNFISESIQKMFESTHLYTSEFVK